MTDPADSGRSRRSSPIKAELEMEMRSIGDEELRNASFDIFDDAELTEFMPKIGFFGAPECRCTTSLMALLAVMAGMVLATSGACVLVFFTQENTVIPLGVTLVAVGALLLILGSIMWCSEFCCGNCLARVYDKVKDAPMKQAIKRRSRMASRSTTRTGSRLSEVSYRTNGTNKTVSTRY